MDAPYAKYTYPWTNYPMFAIGPRLHIEPVLYGSYEGGRTTRLDLSEFFPMSPVLINRGQGKGIIYGITRPFFNSAEDKSLKLCDYIIRKHNDSAIGSVQKLVGLEIKLRYYPIIKEGWWSQSPIRERLAALCAPPPQTLWSPTG